jgi:hypothetical protein
VSVRYLATRTHNQLRENIRINQPAYLAGQASSLLAALGTGAVHESRIHGGEPPALLMPADNNLRDSENVRLKPAPGDIWFVFEKDGNLHLGSC